MLFVDLAGYTALSEAYDSVWMRNLLKSFHSLIDEVVHTHGGFVATFMGDGAMILFGFPEQRLDSATRALAALGELQTRLRHWGSAQGLPLAVDVRITAPFWPRGDFQARRHNASADYGDGRHGEHRQPSAGGREGAARDGGRQRRDRQGGRHERDRMVSRALSDCDSWSARSGMGASRSPMTATSIAMRRPPRPATRSRSIMRAGRVRGYLGRPVASQPVTSSATVPLTRSPYSVTAITLSRCVPAGRVAGRRAVQT